MPKIVDIIAQMDLDIFVLNATMIADDKEQTSPEQSRRCHSSGIIAWIGDVKMFPFLMNAILVLVGAQLVGMVTMVVSAVLDTKGKAASLQK